MKLQELKKAMDALDQKLAQQKNGAHGHSHCRDCGCAILIGYTFCDDCKRKRRIATNKRAARTRTRLAQERAHALLCKEAKDAETKG